MINLLLWLFKGLCMLYVVLMLVISMIVGFGVIVPLCYLYASVNEAIRRIQVR